METLTSVRELDKRENDGIHVRMLWEAATNGVSVEVFDTKTGEAFTLSGFDGSLANEVFHHPYAHTESYGRKPEHEGLGPVAVEAALAEENRAV